MQMGMFLQIDTWALPDLEERVWHKGEDCEPGSCTVRTEMWVNINAERTERMSQIYEYNLKGSDTHLYEIRQKVRVYIQNSNK